MTCLGERELVLYCLNDSDDLKGFYSVSNATAYYNNANNNTNYEGKKWDHLTHLDHENQIRKII